jgi:class 3 adenylate cyclase
MSALFAATYPERTTALVLCGSFAKRIWDPEYPWAPTVEEREIWISEIEKGWGGAVEVSSLAPSMAASESFCEWFTTYGKLSVSPGAAVALARMNADIDIRQVLPSIHVPTLVIHALGDRDVRIGNGRYLAQHIPGARLVELPGEDHLSWIVDPDPVADAVQEFLTGVRPSPPIDRVLMTILFTDMVRSTEKATRLGDRHWRDLLLKHNELVRRELSRFRGREVKTTGDGFLATFDGPARAIRCAEAIRDLLAPLGIDIRAGLHTGECELLENDIGGVAVHIAARVLEKAGTGEIVVTSTVKDLVSGSGTGFQERGSYAFKGVQGRWRLFKVVSDPI